MTRKKVIGWTEKRLTTKDANTGIARKPKKAPAGEQSVTDYYFKK